MKTIVLSLLLAVVASGQTGWFRTGGPDSRRYITGITPGTPPTLTSPNHGFANGARIICHDIWGVPALNTRGAAAFIVINTATNTFQVQNGAGTNLVAPGTDQGGGVCGPAVQVTYPAAPYLLWDPTLITALQDPDGLGANIAPKIAANPSWTIWTRLLTETAACTSSPGSCPGAGGYASNVNGGRQTIDSAVVWFADNSKTQERTDALFWLNNFHSNQTAVGFGHYGPTFPSPVGACAKTAYPCALDGEGLDSRGWLGINIVMAYQLMRTQMSAGEKAAFIGKMLNGTGGSTCTNTVTQHPVTETLTFTSGSTAIVGTNTNFTSALEDNFILIRVSHNSYQWRIVDTVTDATHLTVTVAPTLTGTGSWESHRPWQTGDCGLLWYGAHHANATSFYTQRRRGILGSTMTNSQTTLVMRDADEVGLSAPFDIGIDNEIIGCNTLVGDTCTVVERGKYRTTAATHASGTPFVTGVMYATSSSWLGGYQGANMVNAADLVRLSVQDDTAHNLTWAKTFGTTLIAFGLAADSTLAAELAQEGWNWYHDFHYPFYKDMSTMIQSGGTASYVTRVTGWNALLTIAMKNISGGVIDISDGDWIVKQAYNFGPLMKPWDKRRKMNYTDSSGIDDIWSTDEYNSMLFMNYLYPTRDEVGVARYHIYNETSPTIYNSWEESSLHYALWYEPVSVTCPSTTNGAKCINYRTDPVPHFATITTDYTPTAAPLSVGGRPNSGYRQNRPNGWHSVFSYSDWTSSGTMLWNLAFGVSKDHLPGYNTPYTYQIAKNAVLLADGGYAHCGGCGVASPFFFHKGENVIKIVTDNHHGMSLDENDVSTGINSAGTRGVESVIDQHVATATYSSWRQKGVASYRATFGVTRANRDFLHFKTTGAQDYIIVHDDIATSGSQKLGSTLPYLKLHHGDYENYTANPTTDTLTTTTTHPFVNGEIVGILCLPNNVAAGTICSATPGGLSINTAYYVINATSNTLQLSLTSGGAAIDITSAGTGTTQSIFYGMEGMFSRTNGSISFRPYKISARLNTEIVVAPSLTYSETTIPLTTNGKQNIVRRVNFEEPSATSGARQFIISHQASTSHATTMPTHTQISTISANAVGITIADTVPRIAVFDNNGSGCNAVVTYTISGLSANAHNITKGLCPGTYNVLKNSATILSGVTVGEDALISFTGHGNGAYEFNQSGAPIPITITTLSPLPNATENSPYNTSLTASGGVPPYTWTCCVTGSLPAGITLSSAGVLSGTPTADGVSTFTVTAADGVSTDATKAFSLTVDAEVTSPSLNLNVSNTNMPGLMGEAFEGSVTATGGTAPYTYSANGTLPPGLSINSSTGEITGTPTALFDGSLTFHVVDNVGAQADSVSVLFRIHPGGSDFSFQVRPLGTKAVITIRRSALDANTEGRIFVRLASSNDVIFDAVIDKGAAVRRFVVEALDPLSAYNAEVQVGLLNAGTQFTTLASGGTRSETFYFSVPQGRSIDNVRLEHGGTSALLGTPVVATCTTTCQVTLSGIDADEALWVRYTYRTAANATVASYGPFLQP